MGSHWIVKVGSTLARLSARGDYEDWIASGLGETEVAVCRVAEGAPLPALDAVGAIVITGSSAFVTDRLEWSERTADWLRDAVGRGIPTLGICYGHQLLAHALGGAVDFNPRGREIGTIEVALTAEGAHDPLLAVRSTALVVQSSHRQSVTALPPGAVRLASSELDPNQAIAFAPRAWGVQFHPEWDHDIARAYVEERAAILRDEGLDPDRLARTRPSDDGTRLLQRFAALARS